ncbi:hypothetical protein C0J52_18711 [Blattella germanica]|nr:hypothetical protein C0J52_18711 [Blattella germanica]
MSGGCVHVVSTMMLLLVFISTQVAPEPIDCRKLDSGLEEVLGMYVTPQPIAMPQQSESRGQIGRGHASRDRAWNSAPDQQGLKTDFLYDWYLSNKKRTRESDVAYDY